MAEAIASICGRSSAQFFQAASPFGHRLQPLGHLLDATDPAHGHLLLQHSQPRETYAEVRSLDGASFCSDHDLPGKPTLAEGGQSGARWLLEFKERA
ncbi:hypothetical protein GL58_19300 [Comamonas testosteroni]|uniref:Uncharacterized protein n=1 Tax=Comamonas testosteroni TaxID=285 RepID=A0A0L7N901_COMTE|nr:hypothetical protein GL58_19300 [Comamonas testosteroni]